MRMVKPDGDVSTRFIFTSGVNTCLIAAIKSRRLPAKDREESMTATHSTEPTVSTGGPATFLAGRAVENPSSFDDVEPDRGLRREFG